MTSIRNLISGTGQRLTATAVFYGLFLLGLFVSAAAAGAPTPMTDTGQTACFNNAGTMTCPGKGQLFFGQDGNYRSTPMAYRDNGDGTVTDLVTGLMWFRAVDPRKVSLDEAKRMARQMTLGGYTDWRVPNIKELYSLINFSGNTGMMRPGSSGTRIATAIPYINTDYFNFKYGDTKNGERYIDAQWLSATTYVHTTMNGNPTLFGVNFADGRIKGYGYGRMGPRGEKKFYVRFVRGKAYGYNQFRDNGNGTVTDRATGLTWMQADSGTTMTWQEALAYAASATFGGYSDWRLPNAKELQYIVDYTRSPDTTNSAAIDPVFSATVITNEASQRDFAHYWTGTSLNDGPRPGSSAVTVCFGRAMGQMHGRVMDVHGAGAQRSDPKQGSSQIGRGPQGDARRVKNMVRLVRGGNVIPALRTASVDRNSYPRRVSVDKGYEPVSTGGMGRMGGQMGSGRRNQGGFGAGPNTGTAGQFTLPPQGSGRPGFVSRLDRDGDNRVSRSEFDGPPNHFSRFDRNNDGYLTEDEAPKGPPPGSGSFQ
ncbi:MAG TPA: DUF1566 domain-containing protein [Desulfobacteraceae bacterium]|nr:DUF1566 domain-containing protein [Desulfobacteraceae bacterium]